MVLRQLYGPLRWCTHKRFTYWLRHECTLNKLIDDSTQLHSQSGNESKHVCFIYFRNIVRWMSIPHLSVMDPCIVVVFIHFCIRSWFHLICYTNPHTILINDWWHYTVYNGTECVYRFHSSYYNCINLELRLLSLRIEMLFFYVANNSFAKYVEVT